jgi:hypothetical protein
VDCGVSDRDNKQKSKNDTNSDCATVPCADSQ